MTKGGKIFTRVFFSFLALWMLGCVLLIVANRDVIKTSTPYIYNNIEQVPKNKVGLVLGTSKYKSKGVLNPYFTDRISTAIALFQANKIEYILVSGDNRKLNYNEPRDMYKMLKEAGIPENKIVMDYAGLRTYDSVIRSNKVFKQDSVTIITQSFHTPRAVFIARKKGIKAIGFDSKLGSDRKLLLREVFARVKAFLDIYILNTKPKYLGDKIDINS